MNEKQILAVMSDAELIRTYDYMKERYDVLCEEIERRNLLVRRAEDV